MKNTVNILLCMAATLSAVLLFWPFAMWNDAMLLILRVILALALQFLFCRIGKHRLVKALPLAATGALAAWGTYLYNTSPHWANATFWGSLMADYMSPFLCCVAVFLLYSLAKQKQ